MTDAQIAAYYARLLAEHGPSFRAGDYGSIDSQKARLGALAETILTEDASRAIPTVLDVGCGVGDFRAYVPTVKYTGWDFCVPIIDAARAKWPGVTFEAQDLLRSFAGGAADYVLASGLFQFRGLTYVKRAVTRMYSLAKSTVAFNVLTRTSEPQEITHDVLTIARWCKTLTPRMVVRTDYLPNDAMIILFKD